VSIAEATSSSWRALELSWRGGTINSEPAGWKLAGFDDSAWPATTELPNAPGFPAGTWYDIAGCAFIVGSPYTSGHLADAVWLTRHEFEIASLPSQAHLTYDVDDDLDIWINGTLVDSRNFDTDGPGSLGPHTVNILGQLVVGTNCIAVRVHNIDSGGPLSNTFSGGNPTMFQGRIDIVDPIPPADAVGWDVYAADALNGPILATLANAKGRWIRSELHGLGEGGFAINRHALEATEAILAEGNMVKVRIPDCGTSYIDGFFLPGDGDYTLLSVQGGKGKEDLVFRGDGALSYLDRARMTPCAFSIGPTVTGTWTKVWVTKSVGNPTGVAFDASESGYVYVISAVARKIRKLNQTTRAVVSSSPALWSDSSKWAGGLSFDPDDDAIAWVLEAPWLSGSTANTKIRVVRRSDWHVLATYDLGSAVKLTDIRVDGDYVWTSRYDNDRIQKRDKSDPTNVVASSTITYKGKVQRRPNGIAINGTKIAYWFGGDAGGGTGRALIADTSAYTTITGVQDTKNVSAFGGEWTTEGGEDFLYAVSYTEDKTWKYQLTDSEPACADDSGVFHPEQVSPGALAWRVLVEITHPDRPVQECPDLSFDFTEDEDSNGTSWPARTSTEEFTWRVGDRAFSDVLARLIPAGVTFDLDVNTMTLHAYVDADFGTDRTSGAFAAGKVRFQEAINEGPSARPGNLAVNGDLSRRDNRGQPATYITVLGDGGVYGSATLSGRYERDGFMQVSGPTTEAVLNAIGDDELARQRLVADALGFETLWGDPDDDTATQLAGRYIPKKHYWKGDLVRVDMVAGEFAYNETDLRVYGTLITERDGGWRSALDLGSAYKVPPPIDSVPGSSSGSGASGGGGASPGTTVITAIPLTVSDGEDVNIPRVTKIIAEGVTSPAPGVAVIPSGGIEGDPPLLEELPTDETDMTLVPHPDGAGNVVWGPDATASPESGGGGSVIDTTDDSGAALTLDLSAATVFDITLTDDCTISFANAPADGLAHEWIFILRQDGTGGWTVTWPAEVQWQDTDGTAGGSAPALYADPAAEDVFHITTLDDGVTYGGAQEPHPSTGGGAIPSGTSNPGSPATNDLFYRTDLGLIIKYDGTRWLCICPHREPLAGPFDGAATAAQNGWPLPAAAAPKVLSRSSLWNNDFQIWIEKLYGETYVSATNSGSHYWTLTLTGGVTGTTYGSFNTSADSADTHTGHEAAINAAAGSSERSLIVTASKTGTPGDLYGSVPGYSYRLIVT
jgi:hypothetical protein